MSLDSLRRLQKTNELKSKTYSDYFRCRRTDRNTDPMIPPELRDSHWTSVPFIRLGCQALEERISLDSVSGETQEASDFLRETLRGNGGSALISAVHLAALEGGRAYIVPSASDRADRLPVLTVVPASDMVHTVDSYTGEWDEALRVWGSNRQNWTLYTREGTTTGVTDANGRETITESGAVTPIFPFICRGDNDATFGRPEGKDVFRLQDTATRIASNLSVASSALAVPQRVLIGAAPEDFAPVEVDEDTGEELPGNPPATEELYMSRLLTLGDPGAKIAEFGAAQLQNFSVALNSITRMAAAVMGVPQSVFGVASDANPASGDSMRQDDARLISRAERLTRGFEPTWVDLFAYLLSVVSLPTAVSLDWVDAALPTISSRADAATKLAAISVSGQPLLTRHYILKLLGVREEDIEQMDSELEVSDIRTLLRNSGDAV